MDKTTLTPLISGKSPERVFQCGKCGSYYISGQICEACGVVLREQRDQDLYTLRDRYELDLKRWRKNTFLLKWPNQENVTKFHQKLLKRGMYIIELFHGTMLERKDAVLYWFEFKEIIEELRRDRISLARIVELHKQLPPAFFAQEMAELLGPLKKSKRFLRPFSGTMSNLWPHRRRLRLWLFALSLISFGSLLAVSFLYLGPR